MSDPPPGGVVAALDFYRRPVLYVRRCSVDDYPLVDEVLKFVKNEKEIFKRTRAQIREWMRTRRLVLILHRPPLGEPSIVGTAVAQMVGIEVGDRRSRDVLEVGFTVVRDDLRGKRIARMAVAAAISNAVSEICDWDAIVCTLTKANKHCARANENFHARVRGAEDTGKIFPFLSWFLTRHRRAYHAGGWTGEPNVAVISRESFRFGAAMMVQAAEPAGFRCREAGIVFHLEEGWEAHGFMSHLRDELARGWQPNVRAWVDLFGDAVADA